ncbi:MAG: PRK06851 family protein [Clostridia bacterium]
METKERHFFAGGNTAKGFRHFYASILQGMDPLFILTGGQGAGTSEIIQSVGNAALARGLAVEWMHTPLNRERFDGVLIPALNMGVVDGSAPYSYEPLAPGVIEKTIHAENAWDQAGLTARKEEIVQLSKSVSECRKQATQSFAQALQIHDEWEHIYISNMNMEAAGRVTREMIQLLLGEGTRNKSARVRHQYFGAATCVGAVDYIQDLTKTIEKRYFIKGRPGSGKSTMLKKIAAASEQKGYDTEIFHCGFDPNSLDMVLIPERNVCIFDSTAPHEYFPSREGDEIVDMYERTIVPQTDERFARDLKEIKARYSAKMGEATRWLGKANGHQEQLLAIYRSATDPEIPKGITEQLIQAMEKLM